MAETATPAQYATKEELQLYALPADALPGLSTAAQNGFLQAASGIVESYLSSRYQLPLTTWGIDVVMVVCEIAAYLAVKQPGFNSNSEEGKNLRQGYEDAISWLRDVASGKATPSGAVTVDSSTTPAAVDPAYAVAPAQGSIGASTGSASDSDCDTRVAVGAVGEARLRGW